MNTTLRPGVFDQLSALSDPTRSRLLHVLEDRELTVTELCSVLQLPQSTVSRHLKILSDDGWVASRADGTSRYYRLEAERERTETLLPARTRARTRRAAALDTSSRTGRRVGRRPPGHPSRRGRRQRP